MAISRYGARVIPTTQQLVADHKRRGTLVEGPEVRTFERAFAARCGAARAVSASYGRMAFFYLLKALDLPAGSEVVLPALTFWVVPEMVRVAGLTPVFADVDPRTFNLSSDAFERAITPRTRVVVPTHLWGLPCDMDAILDVARRHRLAVVEDCAHALGATYKGRPVGTLGDAGFFSFQTLKPLNTYGGGMAVANDPAVLARVAELAAAEPAPSVESVEKKLWIGRVQRIAIRPGVFTWTLFPALWAMSYTNARPDVYLWERIRPLSPMPASYTERYANVQAAIGLEALKHLDDWTARTQAHAARITRGLAGVPGIVPPDVPPDRTHVFYQYCTYVPDRDRLVLRAIRRGLDIETLHVDVCTRLDLFGDRPGAAPGAERAATAVQLPVYESLGDDDLDRVIGIVRAVAPAGAAAIAPAPAARG